MKNGRIPVGSSVSFRSLNSSNVHFHGTITSYVNDDWAMVRDSKSDRPDRPVRSVRLKLIPNVFAGKS